MEYTDKEGVETVNVSQEPNTDAESVDNRNECILEKTEAASYDNVMYIGSVTDQDVSSHVSADVKLDENVRSLEVPSIVQSDLSTENIIVVKDSDSCLVKHPDIPSETIDSESVTQVTEKLQEYTVVSQDDSNKSCEYVLESHTQSEYISEIQGVGLNTSDKSQPDDVLNEENQQSSTVIETNDTEENWVIEYPQEKQSTQNDLSDMEQTDISKQKNTESGKDVIEDLKEDNQNVIPSENNDKSLAISVDNESSNFLIEDVEKDIRESESMHSDDAKADRTSVEVNKEDSSMNEVVNVEEANNTDESIVQEQVMSSNNEIVEHVVHTVSTTSSENVSMTGYTFTEEMEVTEIQGEYTIVEGPSSLDISANQQDETENSDGALILIQNYENDDSRLSTVKDEHNEVYLTELRSQSESRQSVSSQSSQTSENKPRRGRKSTVDIPMHVLGHDISKPVDNLPNGRAILKPRLGVKVPYRNLTSQIVSKADIEKEVMERARLRQGQAKSNKNIIFARKLTQRLARKIAPTESQKSSESKEKEANTQLPEGENIEIHEVGRNDVQDSIIHNDSDLLAILEGEGDDMPVLPKEVSKPQSDDTNLKMLEREIALQQLQDLPNQPPKISVYRGRQIKLLDLSSAVGAEDSLLPKSKTSTGSSARSHNSKDGQVNILSDKENESTRQSVTDTHSASRDSSPKKQPVEVEPQVKVNMVLKTYSRKRKTTEVPDLANESPPKKVMASEAETKSEKSDAIPKNVYITKSSRVIKKKVIWDPDETPSRSPKLVLKPETHSSKIATIKTIKPVEKTNIEKVSEKKESTKDKSVEKKNNEKAPKKNVPASPDKKFGTPRNDSAKLKTPMKNKKTRSEVDKLLMDEGAVKMLYDLKNNDEPALKKKKDVYSVEKAHKEIIKKANEIKSDLQQNTSNESPKSLRKKEAVISPCPAKPVQIINSERKMSKDSTRSSLHTPPGSPAYSFSHSQSSMLVRRRSSSSISSSDEVDENDASKASRKKSLTASSESFKSKKNKKTELNVEQGESTEVQEANKNSTPGETKASPYKSFTIKKSNKHISIDLTYENEKCYYTSQVLEELTKILQKIAKDKECNVVSITSKSKAFCLGLDYSYLISDKDHVRKENASNLAETIKNFLLCLLKFPKVLIAGIQGDCVGLGVTMLPLFDMVIASDGATFSTPYASFGCAPEAGYLLSPPIFTNHGLAAELLYTSQNLTADDAFRRGLVSRLCWPEKYSETLRNIVTSVAQGSKQSLEATKKQLRAHLIQPTEAAINSNSQELVEQWINPECQKSFSQLFETNK